MQREFNRDKCIVFLYRHWGVGGGFFYWGNNLIYLETWFLYVVLPLERTQYCVLPVSNLFSVVIMQAMLSDAVCSSSDILGRNQLTWLCPDASVENDNSVWTPGLSTNKCDVYFLHVFCNLFERIEAGCSFFFPLQFFSVYYRSALVHSLATLKFKPDICGQPGHGHGPSETGDGGGDSDMPWSPTTYTLCPVPCLIPVWNDSHVSPKNPHMNVFPVG